VVLFASAAPGRWPEWCGAVTVAMAASAFVLLSADRIARFAGERVIAAFERLVGLVLTAIAIEMLLRGIEAFVRQLERGGPS
jgi:small neutral amino acid transporter SnatA (MarC family)